ncbi:MAG: amidohydrolase [Patescibacteria group bacterium]
MPLSLFDSLLGQAEAMLIALRRDLHRQPELGWLETATAERVITLLQQMGLSPKIITGGIICDIDSSSLGTTAPRIGFRADMDALPIEEETGLEYASTVPGVMHACGHDCHVAMLLMAAGRLVSNRASLTRNIRLLFTRAEEIPPGGEPKLLAEGGGHGLDEVHGLHVLTSHCGVVYPTGTFLTCVGTISCYSDRPKITLRARGGHAMEYGQGSIVSPIDAYAWLVTKLAGSLTRKFQPKGFVHCAAPTPAQSANVVPSVIEFEFTFRALDRETYDGMHTCLDRIIESFRTAWPDVEISVDHPAGHIPTINDPLPTEAARRAAHEVAAWARLSHDNPVAHVAEMDQILGGESFGQFHNAGFPGNFMFLGAGGITPAEQAVHGHGHHRPLFNPDERALVLGVAYWLQLATQD